MAPFLYRLARDLGMQRYLHAYTIADPSLLKHYLAQYGDAGKGDADRSITEEGGRHLKA